MPEHAEQAIAQFLETGSTVSFSQVPSMLKVLKDSKRKCFFKCRKAQRRKVTSWIDQTVAEGKRKEIEQGKKKES